MSQRSLRIAMLAGTLAVAGCGSDGQVTGTSVLLQIRFADDVPEAVIDSGRTMNILVTGAEAYQAPPESLSNQLASHATATIRYRPQARSGQLDFAVEVIDATGRPVGRGETSTMILADREAHALVILDVANIKGDMTQPIVDMAIDGAGLDFATADLSNGADLSLNDFAVPPDQSVVLDQSILPDQTVLPDQSILPDQTVLLDMSLFTDLTMLPDQTVLPDQTILPDLVMLPDLTPLPDLVALPDLFGTCKTDNDCMLVKNQICSVSGLCKTRQAGGGDCTGDGDKACNSRNCISNVCSSCPRGMTRLVSGNYTLGTDPNVDGTGDMDERPQHLATFSKSICVDTTEATVADYRACIAGGICPQPGNTNANVAQCTFTANAGALEKFPINCITWAQATTFCTWAGDGTVHAVGARRLLTEAEWEAQARSNDKRLFPWGNNPAPSCTYENFSPVMALTGCVAGPPSAVAVGSTPLGNSAIGTSDAAGNVWEWVNDWYDSTYYTTGCLNGCTDPQGGTNASMMKVFRGGSWAATTKFNRVAYRNADLPTNFFTDLGVRCAGPTF